VYVGGISEKAAINSLNRTNISDLIIGVERVYCAVLTGFSTETDKGKWH